MSMKIAKYTMYVEIRDYEDITTKELERQIKDRVLSQGALNGTCFLVEERSRIVNTEHFSCEEYDSRPLNNINNIRNPEVWEKELKGK